MKKFVKGQREVRFKLIPIPMRKCAACHTFIHIGQAWWKLYGENYHLGCAPNN